MHWGRWEVKVTFIFQSSNHEASLICRKSGPVFNTSRNVGVKRFSCSSEEQVKNLPIFQFENLSIFYTPRMDPVGSNMLKVKNKNRKLKCSSIT